MRFSRNRSRLVVFIIGAFLFAELCGSISAKPKLILASTTSTLDSGLFDVLTPPFEKKYDCSVRVIAVGTGHAIRIAKDGNADILLVHDEQAEKQFVAEGYGVERLDVMYNHFFIVSPKNDPAEIRGLKSLKAFKRIAETKSLFVSRGDNSGTHKKELRLWEKLSIKPSGNWYIESGTGMEATLRIANEKIAYTLCDRATWLSHKKESDVLAALVKEDSDLFNPYSVIIVSPGKHPHISYKLAGKFVKFIRGKEGQNIIKKFGVKKFGEPLFFPNVVK